MYFSNKKNISKINQIITEKKALLNLATASVINSS
jgi:hypothetical protein